MQPMISFGQLTLSTSLRIVSFHFSSGVGQTGNKVPNLRKEARTNTSRTDASTSASAGNFKGKGANKSLDGGKARMKAKELGSRKMKAKEVLEKKVKKETLPTRTKMPESNSSSSELHTHRVGVSGCTPGVEGSAERRKGGGEEGVTRSNHIVALVSYGAIRNGHMHDLEHYGVILILITVLHTLYPSYRVPHPLFKDKSTLSMNVVTMTTVTPISTWAYSLGLPWLVVPFSLLFALPVLVLVLTLPLSSLSDDHGSTFPILSNWSPALPSLGVPANPDPVSPLHSSPTPPFSNPIGHVPILIQAASIPSPPPVPVLTGAIVTGIVWDGSSSSTSSVSSKATGVQNTLSSASPKQTVNI
ncbi:hypothetical protein K435DRAFT_853644 [Dendrothele bispora CBS 962.96]|uniref:Uncharacterized protein n=1 Tax=Dendrothele bispora (strain CBS 962.96) TaxID=1314807 RepID=A0A4S8MG37_DENBC|nr:hypothetical protein K435DRAFT_853644 [Dendrothele bispora CBS 962.96]